MRICEPRCTSFGRSLNVIEQPSASPGRSFVVSVYFCPWVSITFSANFPVRISGPFVSSMMAMGRQLFHHIGAALVLLMRAVRHIQARHVHAAQNQLAQHSLVIGRRTQRTYDLGFSHLYRPLSFSQTPWPAHQCGLFFSYYS